MDQFQQRLRQPQQPQLSQYAQALDSSVLMDLVSTGDMCVTIGMTAEMAQMKLTVVCIKFNQRFQNCSSFSWLNLP